MSADLVGAVSGLSGVGSIAGKGRSFDLSPTGVSQVASPKLEVQFRQAMDSVTGGRGGSSDVPPVMKGAFSALDQVNNQARSVSDYASTAEASGGQLTPGEIVQLTMRCNEFMFQCQLTSNIANRSSDGVQQLFRQQG
jgi:hypothetical protein